jgi:hypothetical protein
MSTSGTSSVCTSSDDSPAQVHSANMSPNNQKFMIVNLLSNVTQPPHSTIVDTPKRQLKSASSAALTLDEDG